MASKTAVWEQLQQAACPGPAGKLDGFPQLPLEPLCADFPQAIHKTWGGVVHVQSTIQPVTKVSRAADLSIATREVKALVPISCTEIRGLGGSKKIHALPFSTLVNASASSTVFN